MFFIGIITNQKNELYVRKELKDKNIIFINDKNITNMRNIKFDAMVIDSKLNNKQDMRKILTNTKYLILNADIEFDLELIENLSLTIITYGFNSKSTFTVSSITENNIIICLQRIIFKANGEKIEPEEYQLKYVENIEKYAIIFAISSRFIVFRLFSISYRL